MDTLVCSLEVATWAHEINEWTWWGGCSSADGLSLDRVRLHSLRHKMPIRTVVSKRDRDYRWLLADSGRRSVHSWQIRLTLGALRRGT